MEFIGHGDPLWQPHININIGDVGYISDGRFEVLFSACSALEGQDQKVKVPPGFGNMITRSVEANRQGPGCLHTKGVRRIGCSGGKQHFTPLSDDVWDTFTFELSGAEGAALVARYLTKQVDLPMDSERLFEKYLLDNFDVWSQFAKGGPRKIKPVVVSGFDLTGNLVMMSYSAEGPPLESTTEPMFSTDPDFKGKWSFKTVPHCEEYPSTGPDRCVFVRYVTVHKRPLVFRLLGGTGPDSEDSDSGHSESADSETEIYSDEEYDKWDIIADYIFKNSDAEFASMNHRDLFGIITAEDTESLATLLERKRPRIVVVDGVGRIPCQEPRNERGDPPGEPDVLEGPRSPPGDTPEVPDTLKEPDNLEEPDRPGEPGIQPGEIQRDLQKVRASPKSLTEVLSAVRDYYDQVTVNRNISELLVSRVKRLEDSLKHFPEGETQEMRTGVLQRKLEKALQDLEPLAKWEKVEGPPIGVEDQTTFTNVAGDVHGAMTEYQTALQEDALNESSNLMDPMDLSLLKGMHRTGDAGFLTEDRRKCLVGTRQDILFEIDEWLGDEQGLPIFWLNGLAGTGKSAIARTIAEINFADGKLGASFFCSRNSEDRNNLKTIFPALAFQLAHRYPEFRERLIEVLRSNPDISRGSLCSQLEELVVIPLEATQIPTLVIIDALDECKDKDPASALLYTLSCYIIRIPQVKFFITGRPESRIWEGFRQDLLHPVVKEFKLPGDVQSSVDEDIRLYLETNLTNIRGTRSDCVFPEEWPPSNGIDILCEEASGLFIYASTVIDFVGSKSHLPTERLDQIMPHSRDADHKGGVDLLYTQILELAFRDVNPGQQEVYSRFRVVVGTLLLACQSLSEKVLSDLVGNRTTPSDISAILDPLRSLLHVPDNGRDPVRILHKSFPEFLTDRNRCRDEHFFIDSPVHHMNILVSCLDLMANRFKKNICDLEDYAILSEVEDLSTRRETYIGGSLEYACRFWTRHLTGILDHQHVEQVQSAIDKFFATHLLHWIEVLSITGHLERVAYAINDIRQWYTSAGVPVPKLVDDSGRFILEYFDVIRDSPSHIYHSALPLSPPSSWLHECYKAELSDGVMVLMRLPEEWDTCSKTIPFEGQPSAVVHQQDIIAVGSGSNVVLLDAIAGSKLSVLYGHTDMVSALAFSPDGTFLVSGSDDESAGAWDLQTGIGFTYFEHPSAISSVSISPDCATIALGTRDGLIHLWSRNDWPPELFAELYQGGEVTAINFSPVDPRRFISSSSTGDVHQWDVDGQQMGVPCHEPAGVTHVAYSPDGTRFVSYGQAVATVRDSESGEVVVRIGVPNQNHRFGHCCFSPDGNSVACAAGAITYVWDITYSPPRLTRRLVGHFADVTSIAFPSSLISVSWDHTVKIWPGIASPTGSVSTDDVAMLPQSAPIESINLFAEGNIVVTSNSFGEVKTWDVAAGTCKSPSSTQAEGIRDVHLAGDGLIVVCWEESDVGAAYHIWDVSTGSDWTVGSHLKGILDLRISGDGSMVFGMDEERIEARSTRPGESESLVQHRGGEGRNNLIVEGSKVWAAGSKAIGWDFGDQGVATFSLPEKFLDRIRLDFVERLAQDGTSSAWVQDTVTREQIFRLPERYMEPGTKRRWDGRYLLIGSPSGGVTVMDFDRVCHH